MINDYHAALAEFSAANADVVAPVEQAIAAVRAALVTLGEGSGITPAGMSKPDDKVRHAYIAEAVSACAQSLQALSGAILSGGLTQLETQLADKRSRTPRALKLASVRD